MTGFKIGVVGCAGRMGRLILKRVLASDGCRLVGATASEGSEVIGRDVGALVGYAEQGVLVSEDPAPLFREAEAVIDFTTPEATVNHAGLAARHTVSLVIGTTGLGDTHQAKVNQAAMDTAIVQAANMSLGVNLLLDLVERVSSVLDQEFDIEIMEMHHRHKVDAPSGTALALGRAAAAGRGVALKDVSERGRDGFTGERGRGNIGFAVLRGGDVAGEHSVMFAGGGERLELTHKASSREIFAQGAVSAAFWSRGKAPGLYSMRDVLGLSKAEGG